MKFESASNSNSNVSIPPECQRRYDLPHFNRLFDVAHMDRLPLSLSFIVFLSPFVSFHRCFDRSCMPFVFAAAPSSSVVSPLGGNRRARTRSADGIGFGVPRCPRSSRGGTGGRAMILDWGPAGPEPAIIPRFFTPPHRSI